MGCNIVFRIMLETSVILTNETVYISYTMNPKILIIEVSFDDHKVAITEAL